MIGIPKEIKEGEARIALTPKEVAQLTQAGLEILVQAGAGLLAGFPDADYEKAGARLAKDARELFEACELIVKVKEPQPAELGLLRPHHRLFCYLHLGGNPALTEKLRQIGLTAFAFETLNSAGQTPLLAPMSAIAGRLSVQMGSHLLLSHQGGRGVLLGGISGHPQGKVTILGAGVAGTEAAILAHGMGAEVRILDVKPERLQQLAQQLPGIHTALSQPDQIQQWLKDTDLLIGAVYVLGKTAPKLISASDIALMPKGAVAFDIAIDQGGCFETSRPCTHFQPSYEQGGVIHSAITNLPAAVPHSASLALAQAIAPYVQNLGQTENPPDMASALNLQAGKLLLKL